MNELDVPVETAVCHLIPISRESAAVNMLRLIVGAEDAEQSMNIAMSLPVAVFVDGERFLKSRREKVAA